MTAFATRRPISGRFRGLLDPPHFLVSLVFSARYTDSPGGDWPAAQSHHERSRIGILFGNGRHQWCSPAGAYGASTAGESGSVRGNGFAAHAGAVPAGAPAYRQCRGRGRSGPGGPAEGVVAAGPVLRQGGRTGRRFPGVDFAHWGE